MEEGVSSVPRIRVKLVLKSANRKEGEGLRRHFPGGVPMWGDCVFVFDQDASDYDWLVVYDDLPSVDGERYSLRREKLNCDPYRTLFITAEPSTIKTYASRFVGQFGHVLTSQEPWALRHPNAIFSQPALVWFYGRHDPAITYDRMLASPPVLKTAGLSTVCSSKQQTHTLHRARYQFTQQLKSAIPSMDVFGHGVRPIKDKSEAVDAYRYHLAIENHVCRHHWTEKLADAFLGHCLPFYHGCSNAFDYFPEESLIPVDIGKSDEAIEIIQRAIRDSEYEKRVKAISEARRLVLEKYGIFAVVSKLVAELHSITTESNNAKKGQILSRRAHRMASISNALSYARDMLAIQIRHKITNFK
jgi:hypothetical protein